MYSTNQKLNHVITNTDLIFADTLKVDDKTYEDIKQYDSLVLSNHLEIEDKTFVKNILTLSLEKFKQHDTDFQFKKLIRILLAKIPKGHKHGDGIHRDYDELNCWSFLIQLKGQNGNTQFFHSMIDNTIVKEFEFQPLRLIMFPSLYAHQGVPSLSADRFTLNFVVELDTKFNRNILDMSSTKIFNKEIL